MTMTERKPVHGWAVTVEVNGETILTIGHNHLSGIENIEDYADTVRSCAQHLLSFMGLDAEGREIAGIMAEYDLDPISDFLLDHGENAQKDGGKE